MISSAIAAASAPAAASAASAAVSVATTTAAEAGFMAGVLGFFTGWAVLILVVLAVFGILAEYNKSTGWAVFWMILAGILAFFAFEVSLTVLAVGAAAYLVIGFVWSFYRYKRHVDQQVEKHRASSSELKQRVLSQLHPKEMLGTITAWVLIWPFSLVENLLGDIINFVQTMISKLFRGIYFRIYDSAVRALK